MSESQRTNVEDTPNTSPLIGDMEKILDDVVRLFDPPVCYEISRAEAKKLLAESQPELSTQELEERVEDYLAERNRAVRHYETARAPNAHEEASKVVLANDPELHEAFCQVLNDLENLFARSLKTESGGREGMVAALGVTCELINRLTLSPKHKTEILGPLRALQGGLRALESGEQIPPLVPRPRQRGRPRKTDRAKEFRVRGILAVEAWATLENDKKKALRDVYREAKPTAEWLGISARGGFDQKTIANWHQRHTTEWNEWRKAGKRQDDDPLSEMSRRYNLETLKVLSGFPGDTGWDLRASSDTQATIDDEKTWLGHFGRVILESLKIGKIDRPMFVPGRGVIR